MNLAIKSTIKQKGTEMDKTTMKLLLMMHAEFEEFYFIFHLSLFLFDLLVFSFLFLFIFQRKKKLVFDNFYFMLNLTLLILCFYLAIKTAMNLLWRQKPRNGLLGEKLTNANFMFCLQNKVSGKSQTSLTKLQSYTAINLKIYSYINVTFWAERKSDKKKIKIKKIKSKHELS